MAFTIAQGPTPDLRMQEQPEAPGELSPQALPGGTRRWRDVAFARLGGFRPLLLDLDVPAADEPVPVVLYLHGGAFLWGSHRGTLFGMADALLARGIAVATVQYRLAGEAALPAAMHDAAAAIRWLRTCARELGLDPARIGTMGESAGGHLAMMAALNTGLPDVDGLVGSLDAGATVQAGVGWYPVTTMTPPRDDSWYRDTPAFGLYRTDGAEADEAARRWSPIEHVSAGAAPILVVHGEEDRSIPAAGSRAFVDALTAVGADATYLGLPGAGHVFEGVDPAPAVAATAEFFAAHLASTAASVVAAAEAHPADL
jgi:acetyl esterase/lipase